MGRGKHVEVVLSKLPEPTPTQAIVVIKSMPGGNLLSVADADGNTFLCRLPSKFRNRMWVLKGGYLIVDKAQGDEDGDALGKVQATLAHHLYKDQIKHLKNRGLWPAAFDTDEGNGRKAAAARSGVDADGGPCDGSIYDGYGYGDLELHRNTNRRGLDDDGMGSEDEEEEEDDEEEEDEDEDEDTQQQRQQREEEKEEEGAAAAAAPSTASSQAAHQPH